MFVAQANASSWLTGVIVGELIGAEHGIGRMIIEAEARGEAAGMMVAVFVLMIAGVILSTLVRHLQAYLLRWRPAQQLTGWTKRPSPFKRGGGAVIRDGGVRATVSVGPMTPPSA